jgi:hypothetical protein
MMPARNLFVFLSIALVPLFINCAATSDGTAEKVVQGYYYDPASPDRNQGYFANVRDHFREIGTYLPDDDLRDYTATRHITSTPPNAEVYVGTLYMGKTNRGDLYFKPGQYVVDFSLYGDHWSEILSFVEGNNAAIMVRKP